MWEGETVFLVGGGPSLRGQLDRLPALLADRRVIGANQAYELGPWVDVCFFGDHRWFEWNVGELRRFPGLVASCAREFWDKPRVPGWIRFLRRGKGEGIDARPGYVAWNGNTGAAQISLAAQLGARRIVLLGYDMRTTEGAPCEGHNWHAKHARFHVPRRIIYEEKFLVHWKAIARDARALGLEILNATPGSALDALGLFPHVELEDAAGGGDAGGALVLPGTGDARDGGGDAATVEGRRPELPGERPLQLQASGARERRPG